MLALPDIKAHFIRSRGCWGEGKNKRQKWTEGGQLEARWWGNNPPLTRREQAEDRTLAALRVVAIRLADVSWEGGREGV